jgi:hypothetical protein
MVLVGDVLQRVPASAGEIHDLLREIDGPNSERQIRSRASENPRNAIDFSSLAASKDRHIETRSRTRSVCQAAYQFEFRAIPEKGRAVILPAIHKSQNQGVQVVAISAQRREDAKASGDVFPDATD